jgi:hypothetical protein
MRFSLATLVLVILWLATSMLVLHWRDSWVFERVVQENVLESELQYSKDKMWHWNAPDGLRHVIYDGNTYVADRYSAPLFVFKYVENQPQWPGKFIDDVTLRLYRIMPSKKFAEVEYHRRFPEWWWGHFYRPEVWAFIALSGVLLWRAVRARRIIAYNLL